MSNERIFDSFYPLVSADRIKLSWNFQRCWKLVRWKHIKKLAKLFKDWQLGTCPKSELLKKFIFFGKNDSFYPLSRGYRDTTYIWKPYPLLKLWHFGRWTKSKNRKVFVFFGTKFCSLKMTSRISKIPTAQTYFSVDLKYVIWFCQAFWETGKSICISSGSEDFFSIFSKFKPSDRRGRSQFKISPIPWLEDIPMEHLWEKSTQIHCVGEWVGLQIFVWHFVWLLNFLKKTLKRLLCL